MKKLAIIIAVLNITACNPGTEHVADKENEVVEAIKSSIGWAMEIPPDAFFISPMKRPILFIPQ